MLGVAGICGTAVAGLGGYSLAGRRAREQRGVERRAGAYAACIQRWRQVEAHGRDPRSAASMAEDGRLDDLWALVADVELYGSRAVARWSEEVTTRLVDWAVRAGTPEDLDGPAAGFPTVQITEFTAAARADLGVPGRSSPSSGRAGPLASPGRSDR